MRALSLTIIALLTIAPARADEEPRPSFAAYAASLHVGDAVSFENLSIYPVLQTSAPATAPGTSSVEVESLDAALQRGVAEVRERRDPREPGDGIYMSARNSGSRAIAILGGEVLKGSFQDRIVARDTIVPPEAQNFPLAVFCVEHERSAGRRGEQTGTIPFEGTAVAFGAPRMRALAGSWTRSKVGLSQQAIWDEVARLQSELVEAGANRTHSYAVLAEGSGVSQIAGEAVAALGRFDDEGARVGFVVAIGGKVVLADLFGEADLATAQREKLLRSYAIEAHSLAQGRARAVEPPGAEAAQAFIGEALNASLTLAPTGGATAYLLSGKKLTASASAIGGRVIHALVFETPELPDRPPR